MGPCGRRGPPNHSGRGADGWRCRARHSIASLIGADSLMRIVTSRSLIVQCGAPLCYGRTLRHNKFSTLRLRSAAPKLAGSRLEGEPIAVSQHQSASGRWVFVAYGNHRFSYRVCTYIHTCTYSIEPANFGCLIYIMFLNVCQSRFCTKN